MHLKPITEAEIIVLIGKDFIRRLPFESQSFA